MLLASPCELFVHELANMMSAESIIAGMLPELAGGVQHPELASFKDHENETEAQAKGLKDNFKLLARCRRTRPPAAPRTA
jgi:ferritin-like metal-binding protein YciE